jgi:hypothetical protein
MTGSVLAAVVIPVVTFPVLIAWIALVFYADAHPPGHRRRAQPANSGGHEGSAHEARAEEPAHTQRRAA